MTLRLPTCEWTWLAPFACLGLITLSLLRPSPQPDLPPRYRVVNDAAGVSVPVAFPYRGTILTWCAGGYLESTHAPETLAYFGNGRDRAKFSNGLMGRIFPELVKNEHVWINIFPHAHGPYVQIETALALDGGAYLGDCGNYGLVPTLRLAGLPALLVGGGKDWDDHLFSEARVSSSLIGHPERGEALIARYREAFADLVRDLQPETLTNPPRILIMGSYDGGRLYVKAERNSYQIYYPPAGVSNAAHGWTGEAPDAERILAMDPDILFLMGSGQTPQEFTHDPRWLGLKAVRDNRVYTMMGGGGLGGLIYQPIYSRWMAELAHPDRLQPKLRRVMRDRFMAEFNYPLSDDEIDSMLYLERNREQPGYARFLRDAQVNISQGAIQ